MIVTGPKSAGKSTFAKLLINQLLTEKVDKKKSGRNNNNNCVAVLDLDPGQPEFGPPGQVSLVQVTEPIFSPSFCRPLLSIGHGSDTHIIRSHTLASVTPASDPELYLAAITDLITHYRNRIGSLPLVVNTPGWVQGTGLDLLTSLIESIRPSHVLYMASGPLDVIESLQASFKHGEITILPSQTTQYTTRTAAQLRAMQVMSYFHSETSTERQEWNTEPLSMLPPWKVQFSGAVSGILGVICYDYQAPPNVLADAINGTVLALVEVESPVALSTENKDQTPISSWKAIETDAIAATPEGVPYIQPGWALNPKHSQTIGLALLRGIDVANRSLQLLTPVSDERIRQINEKGGRIVLVSGKFDPPSWAYTEDLYRQSLNTTDEGDNEDVDEEMDIIDEDEAVDSEHEPHQEDLETASAPTPWIEVLRGNQKRGTASRVWRVRRDLGRNNAN